MRVRKAFILIAVILSVMALPSTTYAISDESNIIVNGLPWPGMLPTNPLYAVKSLRDKLLEQLISSREKKLEYDIFASNKSFREMYMLYQQGNHTEAYRSGLKAQNYITRFISDYKWMRSDGYTVATEAAFLHTVDDQTTVLTEMIKTSSHSAQKLQYGLLLDFLTRNADGLRALKETMR